MLAVRDAPDLCPLPHRWASFPHPSIFHQTGGVSARKNAKRSGVVRAGAQPRWSPIASGLKFMGPVKGREEWDWQHNMGTGEERCTSHGQHAGFSAPVCDGDSLAPGWLCLLYSLEAFVPLQKCSLSLSLSLALSPF